MASSAAAYPPMSGPAGGTSSSPPVSNVVSDIVPAMSSPAVTAPGAAQAHGPAGAPAAAAAASLPPPSRGAAAPQAQPQPSAQTTTHHHALQPQRVAHVPPAVSQAPQPVSSQPQQQHGAAARPAVAANPPGGPSFVGFPSPTIDHAKSKPRFQDDVKRVSYNIQESLPESVRRAIRDNWEKCLLGSDFHQAFVVSSLSLPCSHSGSSPSSASDQNQTPLLPAMAFGIFLRSYLGHHPSAPFPLALPPRLCSLVIHGTSVMQSHSPAAFTSVDSLTTPADECHCPPRVIVHHQACHPRFRLQDDPGWQA